MTRKEIIQAMSGGISDEEKFDIVRAAIEDVAEDASDWSDCPASDIMVALYQLRHPVVLAREEAFREALDQARGRQQRRLREKGPLTEFLYTCPACRGPRQFHQKDGKMTCEDCDTEYPR